MKAIFFIAGIMLTILKIYKVVDIGWTWIILCFVIWIILFYFAIHKKNRDINTPRPVYMTSPR
jgi:hypothetical protein